MLIKNNGLIEFELITTFGVNIKETDDPIGQFGTGLKYAIATLLRNKQIIIMWRNGIEHNFYIKPKEIRGVMVDIIHMSSPDGGLPLPFTTELGKNWEVWQAVREIYCNALDEEGFEMGLLGKNITPKTQSETIFILEGEQIDAVAANFHTYFLGSRVSDWGSKRVKIIDERPASESVYLNGTLAYTPYRKPNLTYNVHADLTLTEDRTIAYEWEVRTIIKEFIQTDAPIEFIKAFIDHAEGAYEGMIALEGLSEQQENRVLTAYEMLDDKKNVHEDARKLHRKHKVVSPAFIPANKSNMKKAIDWLNKQGVAITSEEVRILALGADVEIEGEFIILDQTVIDKSPAHVAACLAMGVAMKKFQIDRDNRHMPFHIIALLWAGDS